MRKLTRFMTVAVATLMGSAGATFAVDGGAASAAPQDQSGGTGVALSGILRRCDFSEVNTSPIGLRPLLATGWAVVHTAGSTVVADVHLIYASSPGRHYDAELIQVPRPLSSCGPGQSGTAFGSFDLDASGQGMTTLQDTIQPGATGVWVKVQRPGPNSQGPEEFYTSDFVVPIG